MNWQIWDQVEAILDEQHVAPILAVVPDNQDPTLQVSAPSSDFWQRVRDWQQRGWTIGMHGWQHRFVTDNAGIMALNKYSEFAGLSRAEQEIKLQAGIEKFHSEGVFSELWIAPAHSFDISTLELLKSLRFRYLSDGFFLLPCLDAYGITWIPQQLWGFRWRPFGIWTICFHINKWTASDVNAFRRGITRYRRAISKLELVAKDFSGRRKTALDAIAANTYHSAIKAKSRIKRLKPSSAKLGSI